MTIRKFGFIAFFYFASTLCFGQPYSFPVKPGTKEWEALSSYEARSKVCQVPNSVLSSMSDEDLLETCFNHPFAINILLFSTDKDGFESLVRSFNVFNELSSRDRAKEVGQRILNRLPIDEDKDGISTIIKKRILQTWLGSSSNYRSMGSVIVKTPKGSTVVDTDIVTDTDWTYDQKSAIADTVLQAYPGVSIVGPASKKYNCHAYAWHISEGGMAVWMGLSSNPTSIYWTDGSYSQINCQDNGLKVSYSNDNHSAVTTGSVGVFISKWGNGPLVCHSYNNCPYVSTGLNYYIRNYPPQAYIQGRFAQNAQWSTLNTVNIVNRTQAITLQVDYPNSYLITWEKTSGGSDVQYGPETSDGKTAGLMMNSSNSVSLKATAHIPCGTIETEFYFISTN